MQAIQHRLEQGFESASANTRKFLNFAKAFRKKAGAILNAAGCTDVTFSTGHFDISFRFVQSNGQTWYGALSDVRCRPTLYVRRTRSHKDTTGDRNNILNIFDFDDEIACLFRYYADKPLYA